MRCPFSPLAAASLISLAILAGLAAAPAVAIDGYPDSGFGANGSARIPFDLAGTLADLGNAVALDAAARIVIVSSVDNGLLGLDCGVARLLPDGGLDPGFDGDGRATWNLATDAT